MSDVKKVVLAYSGGLDTSVILKWLQDTYQCEVVTFTADLGQGEELDPARQKALKFGIKPENIFIDDLREEFVRDFVFPMFRANALYEGLYLLGTSIARPLISKRLVEIAEQTGADAVSHGATGKGNDQVRFELSAYALNPEIKVIAPWREWDLSSRTKLLDFAEKNQIPIAKDKRGEAPFSVDANLLHSSSEGKVLEDPAVEAPEFVYQRTIAPEDAPDQATVITIGFERGDVMGVGEKAHVEHQIGFPGNAAPIGERGHEHRQRGGSRPAEMAAEQGFQLPRRQPGGIDGEVRQVPERRHQFALVGNAVGHRPVDGQRMAVPGFLVAAAQFFVIAIDEHGFDIHIAGGKQLIVAFHKSLDTEIPGANIGADGQRPREAGFGKFMLRADHQGFKKRQGHVIDGLEIQIFEGFQGRGFAGSGHAGDQYHPACGSGACAFSIDAHCTSSSPPAMAANAISTLIGADGCKPSSLITGTLHPQMEVSRGSGMRSTLPPGTRSTTSARGTSAA